MKKIMRRVLTIIPAVAVQGLWIYLLLKWLHPYTALITTILSIFSFFFVLYVITRRDESTYKILWLLVILTFPLPGALLYLIFGNKRTARPLELSLARADMSCVPAAMAVSGPCEEIVPMEGSARMEQTVRWLEKKTGCPLHRVESVKYYALGDEMYPDMLRDLKAAERFIYIEYFIIAPGLMWDSIAEILEQKVKEGVDVRVMYDDLGSIATFNIENRRHLWEKGIKCVTFNPLVAVRGTCNYRDHRKIAIIDGDIAYTGGANLADEYANLIVRFGYWKDCGIRLDGEGAWGLTRQFMHLWLRMSGELRDPWDSYRPQAVGHGGDFCQPLVDGPDNNPVSTIEDTYQQLIANACRYVWITTPYLAIDEPMIRTLCIAADSGVDVRLMLPGIPDHKFAYMVAQSYFGELLQHGVKIYTYTPGLLHAKSVVADGEMGFVGSVNMDYRSFQLHFECGTLFTGSAVAAVQEDMDDILEKSRRVTLAAWRKRKWYVKILGAVLRPFAMWM